MASAVNSAEDELEQLARFRETCVIPTLKAIAPQLQEAAKAYPAAMRVISNAPTAERRRLENLPVVVVARMGTPRITRPSRNGGVARSSRSRSTRRARAPAGRKPDDDPHELTKRLKALIFECGPQSACTLAVGVRRRKSDVPVGLHAGPFRQVGKGRSARWEIAPEESIPAAVMRFRDGVWKARRNGVIDACEALELLLSPPPAVMARLVEAAR